MSALYNEYLTGAEREAAIIVAEADAQIARLNVLFEAVDATLEANMLCAEAKVFAENGTYDDLTMLYTEAQQEATQKKQGIIASIVQAIANLFAKIGNFISSKFGKKLENIPEGNIKIDANLEKEMNIFKKAWNYIKSPFEKVAAGTDAGLNEEDIKKAWGQIAAEIGAVTAAGAATALVVVNREKIGSWIEDIRDNIQKKVESAIAKLEAFLGIGKKVNDAIKDDNGENPEKKNLGDRLLGAGQFVLNKLREFAGWIAKWMGKLASAIGVSKNQDNKESDNASKQGEKSQENQNNNTANQQYANGDDVGESVSLFGITLDSDEVFTEADMSDEEYSELCELFTDL